MKGVFFEVFSFLVGGDNVKKQKKKQRARPPCVGLFCMADGVAPKCCFRLGFAQRFAEHKSRGRRETQDVACSAWLSLRDVLLFLELAVVGRVFK